MAGIVFAPRAERTTPVRAASFRASGPVRRAASDLADVPLWVEDLEMEAGSELDFGTDHGDEALYVVEGAVEIAGERGPTGGAVLVEAGATPHVRAVERTRLVHLGVAAEASSTASVSHARRRPTHHVVGPAGTYAREDAERCTRFFADSDCDGCATTLFTTGRTCAYTSAPHSHSAPEVLYVLDGTIAFGSHRLGPGDAVGIDADRRYGFRSEGGFTFLNYRPGPSMMTTDRGAPPSPEGARAHGFARVASQ